MLTARQGSMLTVRRRGSGGCNVEPAFAFAMGFGPCTPGVPGRLNVWPWTCARAADSYVLKTCCNRGRHATHLVIQLLTTGVAGVGIGAGLGVGVIKSKSVLHGVISKSSSVHPDTPPCMQQIIWQTGAHPNTGSRAADPAFFRECSTHIHGNFTVQNLIEILARIRNSLSSQKPWAIENFKRFSRGLDPFGTRGVWAFACAFAVLLHACAFIVFRYMSCFLPSSVTACGQDASPFWGKY
eukprot:scaffold39682_cov17-Tisochrysis_lutea.AAC.4